MSSESDSIPTRPLAALWGVAAAAVSVAAAELAAAVVSPRAAPLSAVGDVVIATSPQSVVEWAKQTLGTADKPALQLGTLLILGAIAAGLGIAARRRRFIALLGLAGFGALGAAAAATRPDAAGTAALPSLFGALAGAVVVYVLPWFAARPADDGPDREFDRRRFLGTALALVGVAAVGGYLARAWAQGAAVSRARDQIRLPEPADPAPRLPSDVDLGVNGLTPWRTSNADFYRIDTALTPPSLDPKTYRLRIFGRVGKELTLSYQDLLDRPLRERDITMTCVSNQVGGDLVGNARWLGVPLSELLDEVEPDPDADQLVGRSGDGFTAGAPTALCRDGRDALVAVGMNGAPLPIAHGFPVRMIVPGLYGYVSATKWLTELELTSFADFDAYWVPRGWSADGPIKTESRIDTPRDTVPAGKVPVAGVAWAQHRGIGAVEVRVDSGPWHEARLSAVASTDTWCQWVWDWDAEAGEHTLEVRATDGTGETQTTRTAPVAPDGATGLHQVSITVE